MAHSKQAKKRVRTDAKRAERNKIKKSEMRTFTKRVQTAIDAGDQATALKELALAQKKIDKAAKARVIHPNAADRKKSLLARRVAAIG